MELTSLEALHEKALNEIKGEKGVITINIGGIPKISRSNDIVGNCVQEWIPQWLEDNGLHLEANDKSQVFPDFTAVIDGKKYGIGIKCWNYQNSPGFDNANFDGFYREVFTQPKKLYATYLIFGYTPNKHGFEINNIYLKKVWDITSSTKSRPLGLQVKQGQPYAIRPFPFHTTPERAFTNVLEFIEAIYSTRKLFPKPNMIDPDEWKEKLMVELK